MTQQPPYKSRAPKLSSAEAQARLADALRENLRRRKAQLRARDSTPEPVDKPDEDADGGPGKTR